MTVRTDFGARVREVRKARGLTQPMLALRLAMFTGRTYHQATIAKLESGSRPTSVDELCALAQALDVSITLSQRGDLVVVR